MIEPVLRCGSKFLCEMSQKGCKEMSTTMYASKKNDNNNGGGIIIPFSFPPLRDPTQPLNKRPPSDKDKPDQPTPNWDKRGPVMVSRRYAAMF